MPILISCNVGRVESVSLNSLTPEERALELGVLRVIVPYIDRLDNKLRELNDEVLQGLARDSDESS
jgi:hypothetical protein